MIELQHDFKKHPHILLMDLGHTDLILQYDKHRVGFRSQDLFLWGISTVRYES